MLLRLIGLASLLVIACQESPSESKKSKSQSQGESPQTYNGIQGAGVQGGGTTQYYPQASPQAIGTPSPAQAGSQPPTVTNVSQTPTVALVDIYRHVRPSPVDHFLSRSNVRRNYRLEGLAFRLFAEQSDTAVPLYECRRNFTKNSQPRIEHFTTTDAACERAGTNLGVLGYLFPSARPGAAQLTRCFKPKNGDHLTTLNVNECTNAGYTVEGAIGWVPGG